MMDGFIFNGKIGWSLLWELIWWFRNIDKEKIKFLLWLCIVSSSQVILLKDYCMSDFLKAAAIILGAGVAVYGLVKLT